MDIEWTHLSAWQDIKILSLLVRNQAKLRNVGGGFYCMPKYTNKWTNKYQIDENS